MITEEDFNNWWSSPVADEFRKLLKENYEELAHGTMDVGFCRDNIAKAVNVGRYEKTKELLNMDYEYLTGIPKTE